MTPQRDITDALHLLISKAHLFLGGGGPLSRQERELLTDISNWYDRKGRALAATRRVPE